MIEHQVFPAELIRRYQRFLADIELDIGGFETIYCPNTGAMTACGSPGDTIYYSISNNVKRKYSKTWELTETNAGHLICINPQRANDLLFDALSHSRLDEFRAYSKIQREVSLGKEKSRVDFLLTSDSGDQCYIEVKSCTWNVVHDEGAFPDTVSKRAQKHLRELIRLKNEGHRSILVFVVMHTGIKSVRAALEIDNEYALQLERAMAIGVEVFAYGATITKEGMELTATLPFHSMNNCNVSDTIKHSMGERD